MEYIDAFFSDMEKQETDCEYEDIEWRESPDEPITEDEAQMMVYSVEEDVEYLMLFDDLPANLYQEAFLDYLVKELVERITIGRLNGARVWASDF